MTTTPKPSSSEAATNNNITVQQAPSASSSRTPLQFATIQYTWEDLSHIITHKKFSLLRRHVNQEKIYRLYTQKLRQEWKSVYDFILHCKFQFDRRLVPIIDASCDDEKGKNIQSSFDIDIEDESLNLNKNNLPLLPRIPSPPIGHIWEAFEPLNKQIPKRVLVMNDFPYYMKDDIEHWCLWKLGGDDVDDNDMKWAKERLISRNDVVEIMHWINPVHLKSLPDIDHAHIVCLIKKE